MKYTIAALAAIGALVFGTGTAHAAPVSDFLTHVRADGIDGPDDSLIKTARDVCELLNNENGEQAARSVYEKSRLENMATAEKFVMDAVTYFCPWQDHSGGANA